MSDDVINVSVVNGIASSGVDAIVVLTQAAYDAIPEKSPTTLYVITS